MKKLLNYIWMYNFEPGAFTPVLTQRAKISNIVFCMFEQWRWMSWRSSSKLIIFHTTCHRISNVLYFFCNSIGWSMALIYIFDMQRSIHFINLNNQLTRCTTVESQCTSLSKMQCCFKTNIYWILQSIFFQYSFFVTLDIIRKIILKTILYQFLSTFRINIVDCSEPLLLKKRESKNHFNLKLFGWKPLNWQIHTSLKNSKYKHLQLKFTPIGWPIGALNLSIPS